jgi:hypothetical protein
MNSEVPSFIDWLHPAMKQARASGEDVLSVIEDLAVGPREKAQYFSMMWAYGRHFRIMKRDLNKKTTMDCGISAIYEQYGVKTNYMGYVHKILRVSFVSFETILVKDKWWNSVVRHGNTTGNTLVTDECGFERIKSNVRFMSSKKFDDEPLCFPKDLEQVFYIDDWIHRGWKLVIPVASRTKRIVYKREHTEDHDAEDDNTEIADTVPTGEASNSGASCVSVEVDDNAGEDISSEEDDDNEAPLGEAAEGEYVTDSDDEGRPRLGYAGDQLNELGRDEIAELASDGEMEETPAINSTWSA